MPDDQFWDNGFRHFYNAFDGWQEARRETIRQKYEVIRWQTSIMASLEVPKKHRKQLERVLRLPWDAETEEKRKEAYVPSEADLEEFRRMDRAARRLKI